MDFFLFDLDAVLLDSAGYHRSLVETVRRLSLCLGFGDRSLTQAEIDAFEARDITAEWDSSALCAALLLVTAWNAGDRVTLPHRLPLGPPAAVRHPFPDIRRFLAELDGRGVRDPLAEAEARLLDQLPSAPAEAAEIVRALLRDAHVFDRSLTFRLIQLFNLGSERFERIYGQPAGLDTVSFLETYDRPTLSPGDRAALLRALDQAGRAAAIVTNRPSESPGGIFNTPEAEIGVRAAGFASMPAVASGILGWAAKERGLNVDSFNKPHPVHILAGLRRAQGQEAAAAVEAAVAFALDGEDDPAWHSLDGSSLALFEDAPKGHASAREAVHLLKARGVHVRLESYGISGGPEKTAALKAAGARVFPTVRAALDEAIPGWRS